MTLKLETPETITTILSNELNSLTGGGTAVSAAINNASARYLFANFQIDVPATGGLGGFYSLFLAQSMDGTNFPDVTKISYAGVSSFTVNLPLIGAVVANQNYPTSVRKTVRRYRLPPTWFKVVFLNGFTGLPSSGSTVKMIRFNLENT